MRDAELDLFAAKISQHTKQNLNAKDANYYFICKKPKTALKKSDTGD